jgi:hypothetical protein
MKNKILNGYKDSGAVLVEFLLSFGVIIMILVFFLDAGMTYVRYNLLIFTAQHISRDMAVNLDLGADYVGKTDTQVRAALTTKANLQMQTYITKLGFNSQGLELDTGGPGLTIEKDCSSAVPRCFLTFNDVKWLSFGRTTSILSVFPLKATSRALIEDICYNCVCP